MSELILTDGSVALVDEGDLPILTAHGPWGPHSAGYVYSTRHIIGRQVLLHRFLMGLAVGDKRVVDHVNGDKRDYRRENLEVVTAAENNRRARGGAK